MADSGCLTPRRAVRSRLGPTGPASSSPLPDEKMRRLAGDVADRYVANVKIVESWPVVMVSVPLFFWQPIIFSKAELTAVEREEAQKYAWTEPAFPHCLREDRLVERTEGRSGFSRFERDLRRREEARFHRLLPHNRNSQCPDRRPEWPRRWSRERRQRRQAEANGPKATRSEFAR